MKEMFNRRQRFSLRKYSVGVCSVLLGTALFVAGAKSASADEATATSESAETAASEAQPAATESSQEEATASKAYGEGAPVPKLDLSTPVATSETSVPATEKAEVAEKPVTTENKEAKAETKKEEKAETEKSEQAPKATPTETSKPVEKKESSSKPASTTATRATASENSEAAASEASEAPVAIRAAVQPTTLTGTDRVASEEKETVTRATATISRATSDVTNGGALATSRSRRGRRALTDHNVTPIDVTTTIADNVEANPDMTDPNGASVHSQTIPAGYQAKEGDYYTFGIWNLTKFNARYNTNYYARAYKTFGTSTDTTVELIDKNTGNVVETHTVTATSGVQKFTTTTPKSNNELTLQVDYQAGAGQGPGKTDQPFIQMGFEVGPAIQALVAAGHTLTPAEQALHTAVYSARNSNDILNAVEPTYNGREVTDTNFKIPVTVDKTTYYKVVDQANPTYKETGKSVTTQDYKENGNETSLATYTLKAMEGQNFTASGERQFTKTEELTDKITRETVYKLYQTAGPDTTSGYVSRPYTVGTRFMDAERAGIKRIKEIVDEDGSVVVRVYLLDPKQQSKRSDGTLNTDGYMLLAETKPIKPGRVNTEELVVKKTPLQTIPFAGHPNGEPVNFDFQTAANYTPKKTVFVPFLGDSIGHLSPNSQLDSGAYKGIGTNVDLLNSLTPYKQPIYYYDKSETIKVKPEVEKQLEGRALVDGEFSFKIKENSSSPGVEETVTNKDGKATFSELSFTKEGTYTYTITEAKGADKDVDYDAMEVTMTVKVTKDAHGDLQAEVKYSGTGGFASSADDKVFNNYVVAPVKTKFDFSKALAGRELKAGEFSFVLKDSTGKVLQTKTNTKAGVVAFDDLTFDNTQVGTHKYTVEEVIPENKEAGMTYDTMKAEVTITVTKEGHVLKATNTLPADKEFNNTFTPAATQAQFRFTKRLEGKTLEANAFTFELLENGNVIQTKQNAADGSIQFDAIPYAAAGTHTYTVREVAGTDTNIDYDNMNAVVTVNVTKDAQTGLLNAAVTMPEDTEFNNYAVAPVTAQFDFSKALAGRKLKDGEFSFVLKDAEGNTLQTKTNDADGKVKFDALTFTNTQVGVHKYTVEEVAGSEAGMEYDPMKAEVTITVTKSGHALTATKALPTDTEFNNTFTPAATNAQFRFTKKLEGKELTKDAFTFELLENGKVIQTKKNAADGTIQFDAISYDKEGAHTYTVREVAGADTNIDYDSMNAVVTVNVTKDAASGVLTANVTMPADTEFNNYHVAPVVARFDFTKKLAGRELKDGEFSFVLKDSTGQTLETVTNKADGTVTFSELSFDNTKVGTHTYTVEEVIPSTKELGMTYDTMKATVTVEVAKNGHTLTTVTNLSSTGGVDANGNVTDGTADKEFNNKITPPETPEFQPEKFVLNKEKFDLTGTKLMDDDDELQDEYTETNANPYADGTSNNEAENINTKTVERGDKLVYQVWLDTKNFTDKNNIQSVGISDTYDADKLTVNAADIKAYDSVTGVDVTSKFDITVANGVITATSKSSMNKSLGDVDNTQVIDTTKFAFGRYYKFDIPATVKADVPGGVDIENKANQIVHVYNPVSKSVETPNKPTQKRVNSVPVQVEFNFTKRLEGRELKANEFSFVLKNSAGEVVETVTNDASGNVKFSAIEFKKEQAGVHNYTVEEVAGTDATVTYDTMKANVTVTVSHDGTAKVLVATVGDIADKEFNNTVRPPEEPKFQPEKYVLNEEKFSITDNKLLDDDSELTDKYGETNTNPYADGTSNNEAQNLNTKTVNRGDKLVYQVWLDTTKFDAANKDNIQSVGISDDYDETKLDLDSTKIKAYDSVTGDDVTAKFDITVNNGVITATLKAGFTKSLGDAENTQVIDTTKFAFGRYYKFDIPTTVKADVAAGVDIENTAAQVVNYYNPTTKKVETPNKPTQKRVNSVPVQVEFNFTKRLEGRELKANEFSFVLKNSAGEVVETVTNDAAGNVKFSAIEFKKEQAGVHNYTVEEVAGTDATVTYDTMKANVTVTVSHDGTAKVLVATVGDIADKEFNNTVRPPEEPKFQPEKYVVSEEKFDITGDKLVDDDSELTDKYGETNTNPYADGTSNNESQNLNTKTVNRGDKLVYQVWLDTTKFDAANKDNIQSVGISDDYDETKLDLDSTKIKAYDSVTGDDVTAKFDITVNNGVITATLKAGFTKSLGDAENTQVIDTTKFAFGRYYKFDIPTTVKADVAAGVDIENTAAQVVNYYNPTTKKVETPNKPTQKRVNSVPVQVEFNFTKRLEGRELKANEFSFVLKNSAGEVVETVTNDASGNVKFSAIEFKKEQAGVHNYTVEEVAGTDATVTYDTMKANVTVTVSHDGTAKVLVATVGDIADKEFNNTVRPPEEPKFQPEKYVVSEEKFDITGDKLVDDDSELTDKYGETNTNPYADGTSNNEAQNLNTKTVNRGDKLVYQVWLDTTKFDAANKDNIQSVGISDDYDETKLDLDSTKIKAYDSVTGDDVTAKFDITVNNGVITATLKAGFTKSLGDAENTQVIDTTKFAFGRYYKFDIPTTVKADVAAGVDIENTAAQVVNYYNPTTKKVETPNKPTQKRVNSVPVQVEFNFTKRLEGRELKANEFSFVLKNSAGEVVETVTNDASGNVKFSAIEFKKEQAGVHNYTVEEVAGTDATVTYDTMKANVTVTVSHDGTAKVLVATVGDIADKEFNNTVRPPEEPKFQPEKYVVSEEKFDITGDKLVDDDSELTDKYGETNTNPYADGTSNNEAENINTKTVERGDKLVYQVWLDTKNFTDKNNIQSVGISDTYDADKLTVNAADIKAYDSVTGVDVTSKFDITVANGVITATSKSSMNKSLGDVDNTQVIDTTKFAFGRYYKFDIPATVKADVPGGVDIENKANQIVHVYNPVSKSVETPNKPTQKRVNSVPVQVEFNFTKRLEGRELKANEFSFVLKNSAGEVVETVTNDASGNVKFSAIEFKKEQAGVHNYTVEEVAGTDATVTYDTMKANVTVTVSHDGTAKVLVATVGDIADKEFNNTVRPPEEPKFQPEKYVLNEEKFSITDNKLLDDDSELTDKYGETNTNPYADGTSNNEAQNLNTKTVNRGDKLVYQVWLDTTKFDAANKDNIQSVGISDDYDETKLDLDSTKIKAYDSVTGDDVTAKFDITVNNGVITATLKAGFTKSLGDAENTQVIDTTKFAFGRYYKFDIPTTVKADVAAGVDIENTAAQVVNYYNPTTKKVETPNKPTQKRVNSVPVQVEFNFTKRLEGRELKANEFSFVLKNSAGEVVETVTNDAAGNVKFSAIEFKKEQAGVHNYTVEEVAGTDATVTYDTMKANVTVTVSHDGTAKVLVATVGDIADKEFNNTVRPPEEPKFQPEKYVVSEEKFDITGDKLVDDDSELTDKYGETNTNPYADGTSNNESQNLNTKTVNRGDKLVYQVWLDTTKFDAANKDNIQSVGISDDYDETKLDLDSTKIKAYDSVTGDDVTAKFDITVNNGVITATLKAGFTKSLGDAENTQVIDTTKFAFGRYYKFDIPTTVKADVAAGVDIENTAAQVVNYYNPTTKKVETPNKPTQKRVNSVPVQVEFNFTKRLEGRELKANEFSFVLKNSAGEVVETVTNDAAGNVKFSAIEFKKEQAGVHNYTVEEVAGTDATVTYDTMKANVTVTVSHDGTAKVLVATVGDIADKEFNNRVTPPETPEFNPEKYILNEEKFDITGNKLLDDDKELTDKVADTNKDPYVDKVDNNEKQNINTQTLHKGDKVVYQVWLDTTKFTEAQYIQSVGITDKYDSENLDVNVADIKAYDSVTGEDVTAKFDISIVNGVITATSKADLTKSLGDAENTQVIDTTKFAFGRYYKFDIPARIKGTAKEGVDIENTASQIVHQYDPTKKSVDKPEKPTEKRVVNIPVKVEFNFTKKLEGRALKAGEFSFVLKDKDGNVIETVSNDAEGKIKFSALEFKRGEEGTYIYHVEEVKGTEAGVEYDKMVATVGVTVTKDGKVLTLTSQMPEDTEFNNKVIPPKPPVTPPTPPVTPPTPPVTPPTPPVTPPTPPVTPPTPPVTPPTPPVTPPAPELPSTGEEQSASAALLGAALGLVGLAGLARRKKNED